MTSPSEISDGTVGWFPVVTLFLGFAMSSISEWVKYQRESERDREARKEAKRQQLSEQRRVFQRETLLALQEATFDVMRTTGEIHHHDEMAFRKTGLWQKHLLDEDLNQKNGLAMRRTLILGLRVRDAKLRELVLMFKKDTGETLGMSREESATAITSAGDLFEQVQDRVGELLRTLDDEETAT